MMSVVEATAELPFNWTGCAGCVVDAPPPDTILQIPPPPLPSFLQMAPLLLEQGNLSGNSLYLEEDDEHFVPPCNPHCDWSNTPGVEYVELSRKGAVSLDDTWFLVLVGSSVAVLLLGALLAFALLKCKHQRSRKNQMEASRAAAAGKLRPVKLSGHCCGQPNDPHALWAALTTKGTTAHFAVPPDHRLHHGVDFCRPTAPGFGYYGALDPRFPPPTTTNKSEPGTPESQIYAEIPDIKMGKLSSFDNTAFEDYAYEDMPSESFPLAEVSFSRQSTLSRFGTARPMVSPPTRIDAPNLPPLNQMRQRNQLHI
ncbi:Hypothetical predicted protein [Cloeon dipterum]|uniref:Uncharacterized protein n=1 Tax=Cloeon dipterum TaxID=197152 RepID=A0A8S1CQW4_9INSE|nr:Hypothetical predicted protein [Cloeon dipterum]